MIDTAEFYHNEDGVGNALKLSGKKREDVFVVSKWWPSAEGAPGAIKTLDRCLKGFLFIKFEMMFISNDSLLVYNRVTLIYIFFMHHKVVIVLKLIVHYLMQRNRERLGKLITKKDLFQSLKNILDPLVFLILVSLI